MNRRNSVVCMVGILVALAVVQAPVSAQQGGGAAAPLVRGSGTPRQIPMWVNGGTLGDSVIHQGSDGSVHIDVTSAIGLFAITNNTADGAAALLGHETAATGVTFGVHGFSASPNGVGVQGEAPGNGMAGFGGDNGVIGLTTNATGLSFGVQGINNSDGGYGSLGHSTATTGRTVGTAGFAHSPEGVAGQFWNAAGGQILQGQSGSDSRTVFSVDSGGLFVDGDLTVTGSKNAVVRLSSGKQVALNAVESPESWFEDFGVARLSRGVAEVSIDPVFGETVSADKAYHVFLTPNGNCRGLYVAHKAANGFTVRELMGGRSDIDFAYRIVVRRKGHESVRLEAVEERTAKRVSERGRPLIR